MKKITYSALLMLLTLSGYQAVAGTTFYHQDFSLGIPAVWKSIDSASTGVNWLYTHTGNVNTSLPFPTALDTGGTTSSNGYIIFDSDASSPLAGDGWLITDSINCSTKSRVHLSFNEYFAQWLVSKGTVLVSNDHVNWTPVHHADSGLAQDQTTANPKAVDIDISSLADGKSTVYIAFHYKGTNEYFWEVDDISLYEVLTFDGGITDIDTPMTSCNLALSTTVSVIIKNFGADTLSDFPLSYSINAGTPVSDSCHSKIAPGASLVFTFATPGAIVPGVNTIMSYTSIASDPNQSNDTASVSIYNGPHPVIGAMVYTDGFEKPEDITGWKAWDANTSGSTWAISGIQPHSGSLHANLNEANADDWYFSTCIAMENTPIDSVYKLDFYYRTFSGTDKADMEVKLFTSQDTLNPVQTIVPTTTVIYTINAYNQSSTLFPVAAPGIYYIGFHGKGVSGFNTSLEIDDIDLRLVKSVGLNDVAAKNSGVVLYPNPNTGMFNLANLKSFNGPVQINIFDMMGNSIYNQMVNGDRKTIDLASQPAGVYMVRLTSQTDLVTKMVTITK